MTTVANDPTQELVRAQVRSLLTSSPAYQALDADTRKSLAHDMVQVTRFMVDANGQTAGVPMNALVSTGLADRADQAGKIPDPRGSGERLQQGGGALAAKEGGGALTDVIRKVNFPSFVAGLVDGVFNAIVSSSIKQMEAYSDLLANVAKSVDQYMRDNVTPNQARDYLADKYPEHLKVDTQGRDGPKLVPQTQRRGGRGGRDGGRGGLDSGRGGRPDGGRGGPRSQALADPGPGFQMPDFMKDLGLPQPIQRLDQKTVEDTLVPAAQKRLAMDRQQLLATMVLMGINRLIVTDGKISASCLFTLDTTDTVTADTSQAASFDEHVESKRKGWSFWFMPAASQKTTSDFSVSTTQDVSSTTDIQMHAELSGNVDINFRSETFPLEKMADMIQIKEIEQKAPAAAALPAAPAPGMKLPPPPPLPSLPGFGQPAPPPAAPAPGA